MRDAGTWSVTRLRGPLFAVCAVCTVWLLIQNTVLFALLPWMHVPALVKALMGIVRVVLGVGVPLSLVPLALMLGWWASRPSGRAAQEGRHE